MVEKDTRYSLGVKITLTEKEELEAFCKKYGYTKSQVIRWAIKDFMKRKENADPDTVIG